MKIIIDVMGGDKAPEEIIEGCVQAVNKLNINLVLVGKEKIIKQELRKYDYLKNKISIINAEQVIENEESPTKAIRTKKDSSMVVGLKMLKKGLGDAFVSAGNTGALLTGSLLLVGRIKGVDRPALTPVIPTDKGAALLIDAGANTNCKPINLLQFAIMGSAYMEKVIGVNFPKIGLVNVGVEEEKGNDLTKASYKLLKSSNTNFIGNIEARSIPEGLADIIVCDGSVGNIILKLMEGVGITFYNNIKNIFKRNILSLFAALLLKKGLTNFKKKIDYTEYGGAPFLGINGIVIKSHGSSEAKQFYYAIKQAKDFIESKLIEEIKDYIDKTGDGNIDANI